MTKLYFIIFLCIPLTVFPHTQKGDQFFETVEELQEALVKHNKKHPDKLIHDIKSYRKFYRFISKAHSNPNKYYGKKWSEILSVVKAQREEPVETWEKASSTKISIKQTNGSDNLSSNGKSKVKYIPTVKKLQQALDKYHETAPKDEWIVDEHTYNLYYRNIKGAPPLPYIYYEEWVSWEKFFEEQVLINKTSKELKQVVRKDTEPKQVAHQKKEPIIKTPEKLLQVLVNHNIEHPDKQIDSPESYARYLDFIKGAPPNPYKYYGDAWPGTKVFFKHLNDGCEKIFREAA